MSTATLQPTATNTTAGDRTEKPAPVTVTVASFGCPSDTEAAAALSALTRGQNVAPLTRFYGLETLYMGDQLVAACFPTMHPVDVSARQLISMHVELADRWLNIAASNLANQVGRVWAAIIRESDLPGGADARKFEGYACMQSPEQLEDFRTARRHRIALFLRHLASLTLGVHHFRICFIHESGEAEILTLDEMLELLQFKVVAVPA